MVFMIADSNKDGSLTRAEIKAASQASGEPVPSDQELDYLFAIIDTNRNGKIENAELYNFVKLMSGVQLYTKTEQTDLIFSYYDANYDGYLSQYEVKRLLADSFGYATDADAEWFIAVVDSNFDGKISWYELYYAIQ